VPVEQVVRKGKHSLGHVWGRPRVLRIKGV
jgi:hypothetical protein